MIVLRVVIGARSGTVAARSQHAGLSVSPVNAKTAQRDRDCKAPSGGKSHSRDARSYADTLRINEDGGRILQPRDPRTGKLRPPCRDEVGLIEQRTAG